MKSAICIGCGCDDLHGCPPAVGPQVGPYAGENCSWLRFSASSGGGVCSACEDLVKGWDQGQHDPILALIAERYYRQVLFLYEDKASAIAWMLAPQYLLRHNSPRDLILQGRLDLVQELVHQLADGAYA